MTGFRLGTRSRANLARVHPKLVAVVEKALTLSAVDFGVPEKSWRTFKEQQDKVRAGVSKTMHSNHLVKGDGFGWAVDLVPFIAGRFTWDDLGPFHEIARAMRQAADEQGVRIVWGGVWDREIDQLPDSAAGLAKAIVDYCARHPGKDFIDYPHFQLEAA